VVQLDRLEYRQDGFRIKVEDTGFRPPMLCYRALFFDNLKWHS
jgi:hypothetical protein